jgi:hypothetical protein
MRSLRKYILLADRFEHKRGTIVYECRKFDYGLARDDTRAFGVEHTNVTLKSDGDYPAFTIPIYDLGAADDQILDSDS